MPTRFYDFQSYKSRAREREELAADIREITPAVKVLAEAERRRTVARTCRMIARREKRERRQP